MSGAALLRPEIASSAVATTLQRLYLYTPSDLFSGGVGEFLSVEVVLPPSAALLAAHRALIVAANCARRSGERFSFLFGFFMALGFFALARAADFLAALNAFADSACCSLRRNLANLSGPSRKRFSSSWIFFFNFFGFIFVLLLGSTVN
jgi:hypothetical protein